MKKLILSLSIVAVATAGSAQGTSRYEELKKSVHRLKTLTLASDAVFFYSAAYLAHAAVVAVPTTGCVAVPAAICGKAFLASPAALPIMSTFFSGIVSTASRVVTMLARNDKENAKATKYTV